MFQKATRKKSKLRLALMGPAGGGKTYSALAIGTALAAAEGKRVALMDTEAGSASKYADGQPFDFDSFEAENFEPETYVRAIDAAAEGGYGVIILDSLSHAWGALLDAVDAQKRGSRDGFGAWKDATPRQASMVEAIIRAPIHVIATVRTKMETVREVDEKGKTQIRKVGLKPVQRDGLEYEFDVVIDLDDNNVGLVTKSRCPAITGKAIRQPGERLAKTLLEWLQTGVDAPERSRPTEAARASASGTTTPGSSPATTSRTSSTSASNTTGSPSGTNSETPRNPEQPRRTTTELGWNAIHEKMGELDGAMTLEALKAAYEAWKRAMGGPLGDHVADIERAAMRQYLERCAAALGGPRWEPTEDQAGAVELLRSSRARAVLEQPAPREPDAVEDGPESGASKAAVTIPET